MATYNFKQEAKVYVVSGGNQYRIDVSDVSFSQTFSETSYSVKTLHEQSNVFEGSVINKANAANFEFRVPVLVESDYTILETLLIGATSFDLFVKTEADTFKLETAVITNGSFVIERSRPLSLDISGEAAKLTRNATLTGTAQSRSSTSNYIIPSLDITIGSTSLSNVVTVGIELQNEIKWTPYTTVNNALSVTNASNSMYPSAFTLDKKILSGSISQYLTDGNTTNTHDWDTDASITVKAGNGESGNNFRGFSFGPATCSFTNRINSGSIFRQSYDWRMTQNPSDLATILKYETD
ncbi:MAG: hypothetical protein DWQ49_12115 [Bacteroidetes bacterium]|nr:MAG: hypothetical protein DWQ49_12115 [Bacteroidota bacterium]